MDISDEASFRLVYMYSYLSFSYLALSLACVPYLVFLTLPDISVSILAALVSVVNSDYLSGKLVICVHLRLLLSLCHRTSS